MIGFSTLLIATPLARADDQSDAKAVAASVIAAIAHGDNKSLDAHFAGTGVDMDYARTMLGVYAALGELNNELAAKFGKDVTASRALDPEKLISQVQASDVVITGDNAELVIPGTPKNVHNGMLLKRQNGEWKVLRLIADSTTTAGKIQMMQPLAAAMRDTASELKAGKYSTIAEVGTAVQQKMRANMQAEGIPPASQPVR